MRDQNTYNTDTNQNDFSGRGRLTNAFDNSNGINGGQLTEQQVRAIIKDELLRNANSGVPVVPRHTHDGNNSPQIPTTSVIYPTPVNGTIDMAQQTTYTLNLTGKGPTPKVVTFYGGALNPGAGVHAMIVGSAYIGANQQFQPPVPPSTISVITGPILETIIQGSASITVVNAAGSFLKNSQGHIIYAEQPSGTPVAIGDITSVTNSAITVSITTLVSGWTISGLWTVA